jgi:cytochrome c-type biogenesis protein CcmH/NrfG
VGREEEAWQSSARALVATPNYALALTGIAENSCGTAAATAEILTQGRRLLRLALRQAPHSPTVLAALAAHCFSRGDRERGLALTQQLRQLHPGCPQISQQCRSLVSSAGAKLPAEAAHIEARPCPGACQLAGIRAGL